MRWTARSNSRCDECLDHADKARIDMLTTGIRTPVGIKIFGARSRTDRTDR